MVSRKTVAGILFLGITIFAVIMTAGCVNTGQTGPADTLFLGNVITMDDKNPTAEAVAVKDGIILFVGSEEEAKAYCDENTEVVDYGDYSIYPGFLEAHMHVSLAGMREYGMIPLTSGVPLAENIKELEVYIKEHPRQKNYVGFGWVFSNENPTAAMIDAVCPDVPVILQSSDGHSAWVNSKYLEGMNLTPEYIKKMGPQQIHVDASGKPTGYLQEEPAIKLVKELPFTVEEVKGFILKWQNKAIENGYTAVCDAGLELCGDSIYQALSELDKEGKLKLRIYGLALVKENTDTPEKDMERIAELAKKYNSEHFKIIGAKIFLDGVTEEHTSWLLEPYTDKPDSTGIKLFSDVDRMADLITAANKYGMLVHAHTMGDGAVHTFADAVEKSVKETGNYDQRNAAAHLQYVTKEDIERFGKYGIVAVSGYLWSPKTLIDILEENAVGPARYINGYPAQSFIDAGAVVVGHSDSPISLIVNIPLAVYSGIYRNNPFKPSTDIVGPQEKMSAENTLKTITSNVAYMWHEENRMGTLEPGKLANMAVLDVDFLHDDKDKIANAILTENVATVIDGKVVYSSEPVKKNDAEEILYILSHMDELWAENEEELVALVEDFADDKDDQ